MSLVGSILLGPVASGATALFGQHKQNRANLKLAEYQYSKDLEMWNKSNEYNSPVNQMSRLKSAGLNPNLVYGNGSVVGNTSSSLPQYQAPKMEYDTKINPLESLSAFLDIKAKKAQIDQIEQQTANLAQENYLKDFFRDDKKSKLGYEIGILMEKKLRESNLNELDFNSGEFGSDGVFDLNDSYMAKLRDATKSKLGYEIGILMEKKLRESNLNWLDFNRGEFGSDGVFDLNDSYMAKLRDLTLDNIMSSISNKNKDLVVKDKIMDKYSAEIRGMNIRNAISDIEKAYMENTGMKGMKDIIGALISAYATGGRNAYLFRKSSVKKK
nr:MAG: DNA pilot protein [Microvirus sp.]